MEWWLLYPGPRGFLLFFIGKFCDANRFLNFFIDEKRLEPRKESFLFLPTRRFDQRFAPQISKWKKDNIKRKPLGPGYGFYGYRIVKFPYG